MLSYLTLSICVLAGGTLMFLLVYSIYSMIQEFSAHRVPALLYHQFLPKAKVDSGEIINRERVYVCYDTAFAEQMEYLHREGYTTISLDDFLAAREEHKPLPTKSVILTFDDGFMSNYLYAFPILKKYGFKATIFVTPDPSSDNFKKYASQDSPLTHDQIREMSEYGISIESHGMTHRYLTLLPEEVIKWELQESRKVLENIVHKPVQYLAIPSGAYNRTVKRIAKETGYKAVFCMLKGSNNLGSDLYALKRLVVARDFTLDDFKAILSPLTASHLRITSFFQNFLLSLLGPSGLDAFRNGLYRSPIGSMLVQGQLHYFVGGVAVVCLVSILVGLMVLI